MFYFISLLIGLTRDEERRDEVILRLVILC